MILGRLGMGLFYTISPKWETGKTWSVPYCSQVAKKLHTSQARVARMEAGDPSVSMELLVKGMIKLGASKKLVGQALVSS
ncbi:hypothetical protein VU11_07130 [Desulfobulbus sp. US2]|nr:hypothetical protein [Desulfobulbus sp. US2]